MALDKDTREYLELCYGTDPSFDATATAKELMSKMDTDSLVALMNEEAEDEALYSIADDMEEILEEIGTYTDAFNLGYHTPSFSFMDPYFRFGTNGYPVSLTTSEAREWAISFILKNPKLLSGIDGFDEAMEMMDDIHAKHEGDPEYVASVHKNKITKIHEGDYFEIGERGFELLWLDGSDDFAVMECKEDPEEDHEYTGITVTGDTPMEEVERLTREWVESYYGASVHKTVPSYHVCDNCGYITDDNLPNGYTEGMACPECGGTSFHHEGFFSKQVHKSQPTYVLDDEGVIVDWNTDSDTIYHVNGVHLAEFAGSLTDEQVNDEFNNYFSRVSMATFDDYSEAVAWAEANESKTTRIFDITEHRRNEYGWSTGDVVWTKPMEKMRKFFEFGDMVKEQRGKRR